MPPKSKQPSPESLMPWEGIKASTLRTLCQDLGLRQVANKNSMISFLHDVERNGVEKALANAAAIEPPNSPATPLEPAPKRSRTQSLKRKKPVEEDEPEPATDLPYNTRHKGLKHPRVTYDPTPKFITAPPKPRIPKVKTVESISDAPVKRARGRPRRTDVSATPSKPPAKVSVSAPANGIAKRGRGRPRKSAATETAQAPPSSSIKKKEVFFGVVMTKSRVRESTEDDDADGEIDDGEGALVLPNGGETSSLGSSNKENHPDSASEELLGSTSLVDALNFQAASSSAR